MNNIDCFFEYTKKLDDIETKIEYDIFNIFGKENKSNPLVSHVYFNKKNEGCKYNEIIVVLFNYNIYFEDVIKLKEYFGTEDCIIEYNKHTDNFVCIFRKES